MSTGGYGGRKIRESVRIKTNDPNRPWIDVAVTGMVEKFAEVRSTIPIYIIGMIR